jgi:hypothetical protein
LLGGTVFHYTYQYSTAGSKLHLTRLYDDSGEPYENEYEFKFIDANTLQLLPSIVNHVTYQRITKDEFYNLTGWVIE